MNSFIIRIKTGFVAVFSALASWLGILYVPMSILIISNFIDYATGLCAAKYRNESVNSYRSVRGIAKKICMWLLVGVGAMLDMLLNFAAAEAGAEIPLEFMVASVAAVWLIANELISILENIKDIGAPLPPFLMKIAENVRSQSEISAYNDSVKEESDGSKSDRHFKA